MNKYHSELLINLLEKEIKECEGNKNYNTANKQSIERTGIHSSHSNYFTLDLLEAIKKEYNEKITKYESEIQKNENNIKQYSNIIEYLKENIKSMSLINEIEITKNKNEQLKKQIEELKKEKNNLNKEHDEYNDFRDEITEDYIYWLERHFWKCVGEIPSGRDDFICYKH